MAAALTAAIIGGASSLYGAANAPEGFKAPFIPFRAAFGKPLVALFQELGGNIEDLEVERRKGQRGFFLKSTGEAVPQSQIVGFERGRKVAVPTGKFRALLDKQAQAAEQKAIDSKTQLFDRLFGSEGPQFLKDLVVDRPQQVRDAFGPAVSDLLQRSIGAAAPRGTLTTPGVLERAAAPVALEAEKFFQSIQDRSNSVQLASVGGPSPSVNSQSATFPQGIGALQSLFSNTAALNSQLQIPALQSQSAAQSARFGSAAGLGSSGLSIAAFLSALQQTGTGGGSGGGSGGGGDGSFFPGVF